MKLIKAETGLEHQKPKGRSRAPGVCPVLFLITSRRHRCPGDETLAQRPSETR